METELTFRDLLHKAGLDPKDVALLFHTPKQASMRKALRWMAAEREELFNTYQSVHSPNVEATIQRRSFVASFVVMEDNIHVFIAIYKIEGFTDRPLADVDSDWQFRALVDEYGDEPATDVSRRIGSDTRRCFSLKRIEALNSLSGRLIVNRPSGRNYVRLADTTNPSVRAIQEYSALVAAPPDWRRWVLTAKELRFLPRNLIERLSQWRGVYLIVDQSDGARYVGAAWGKENIHQRWQAHVAGTHGVTAELSRREVENFRFSILERVSPDMEMEEVIERESDWKLRLDTINHGLNRN